MRAIRIILVAIDGSKPSFEAAVYGVSIARQFNSEVILLHVIPSLTRLGHSSGIFGLVPSNFFHKEKDEAEKWIKEIRSIAIEFGVPLRSNIISTASSPGVEIVKFAENEKVDMIILATRGMSGMKRMLLGSTATVVVKYASSPVLVVK